MMKTPVVLVAAALTIAILLTASLLIATKTRGAMIGKPILLHGQQRTASRGLALPHHHDNL
jgi:hypothetical protein